MKAVVATLLFGGAVFACADSQTTPDERPSDDAGKDVLAPIDAATPEAGCADCAWFPSDCTRGTLCRVPVDALDPRTVLFALEERGDDVMAVGTYGSIVDRAAGSWRRSGLRSPDALRAVTTVGGEVWTAGSIKSVFTRPAGGGEWTETTPNGVSFFNWPVNGLYTEPQGTWVWAASGGTCSTITWTGDGIGLVRLQKSLDQITLETIIQHRPPASPCLTMNALDGAGGALWVVGDRGVLYKVTDLESASPIVSAEDSGTTRSLLGVWAEPSGHVFLVGKEGVVMHRAPGGAFVPAGEGVPPVAYHAVRGTSPSDVWIAGEEGIVMHFDGQRWSRVALAGLGDQRPTLRAIAALASDRVWITGDNVLLGLAREDGRAP